MGNGKTTSPAPAVAYYDFYKTNELPHSSFDVMPGGPSMCRQEFAEECDINSIMRRYEVAGATINGLPPNPNVQPVYVDLASAPSTLLEYMELMKNAESAFMTLPAMVRREFDNDPTLFVDFASDPANLDQMRTWGLAPPAKAPAEAPGASVDAPKPETPAPPKPSPAGS